MGFISSSELSKTLDDAKLCIALLDGYFRRTESGGLFQGRLFNFFEQDGGADTNRFTSSDLLACSLLRAEIGATGVAEILVDRPDHYSELLRKAGADRRFADIETSEWADKEKYPGHELYRALVSIYGVGDTRATKLMARKRPSLFPIVDSRVRAATVGSGKLYWAPFNEWLRSDNFYWHKRLDDILEASTVAGTISTIRAFDVIAWLVASKKTPLALA